MTTTAPTPRFGLVMPNSDDPIRNGDNLLRDAAAALDPSSGNGGAAKDLQGLDAAKPTGGSQPPKGVYYFATDTTRLYRSDGAAWREVAPAAVGSFSVWRNAALSLDHQGVLKCDTEDWDVSGWHDPATGRFQPQAAGYYRLNGRLKIASVDYAQAAIYKNGGLQKHGPQEPPISGISECDVSCLVSANVNDYFELRVELGSAGVNRALGVGSADCFFQGELVGRI